MKTKFKIGDQIVYVPAHADNESHPDAEYGFITGFNPGGDPFCRYWLNPEKNRLRTKANSECTPIDMIRQCNLKPQSLIDKLLMKYGYKKEK